MAAQAQAHNFTPAATGHRPAHRTPPDPRLRWARLSALACIVGLVVTWFVADHVAAARAHDAAALAGFINLGRPWVDKLANDVLSLVAIGPCALFGAVLIAIALLRGRPRVALVVPVMLIGSVLMCEALKPLLAHPHVVLPGSTHVSDASWPSGHSTEAMAMALSAVLVVPRAWRPMVALLGAIFTTAVAFSLLTLAWHMPSDVVGGFLLAALWMSIAVSTLLAADARWPARSGREAVTRVLRQRPAPRSRFAAGLVAILWLTAAACAAVVLAAAIALAGPQHLAAFAGDHRSVLVAAALISLLAATLVTGLLAVLRR